MRRNTLFTSQIAKADHKQFRPADIIPAVCAAEKCTARKLKAKTRKAASFEPRNMAVYLYYLHTSLTLKEIAKQVGLAGHTSIIRHLKSVANRIETDPAYVARIDAIKEHLFFSK